MRTTFPPPASLCHSERVVVGWLLLPTAVILVVVSHYKTLLFTCMLQKGQSPLWRTSYSGHSDVVLLLLQHNAQVDLPTNVRYMQ